MARTTGTKRAARPEEHSDDGSPSPTEDTAADEVMDQRRKALAKKASLMASLGIGAAKARITQAATAVKDAKRRKTAQRTAERRKQREQREAVVADLPPRRSKRVRGQNPDGSAASAPSTADRLQMLTYIPPTAEANKNKQRKRGVHVPSTLTLVGQREEAVLIRHMCKVMQELAVAEGAAVEEFEVSSGAEPVSNGPGKPVKVEEEEEEEEEEEGEDSEEEVKVEEEEEEEAVPARPVRRSGSLESWLKPKPSAKPEPKSPARRSSPRRAVKPEQPAASPPQPAAAAAAAGGETGEQPYGFLGLVGPGGYEPIAQVQAASVAAEQARREKEAEAEGEEVKPPVLVQAFDHEQLGDRDQSRAKRPQPEAFTPETLKIRSHRHAVKVVRDRVYSVCMHPSNHAVLAVVGDKWGKIGFWRPLAVDVEDIDDDDVPEPTDDEEGGGGAAAGAGTKPPAATVMASHPAFSHRRKPFYEQNVEDDDEEGDYTVVNTDNGAFAQSYPHARPVSSVLVPRDAQNLVFSSCYDGTCRVLDAAHEASLEVLDLDGTLMGYMDVPEGHAGSLLYAATHDGEIAFADLRDPALVRRPHLSAAHDRKTSSVQVRPGDSTKLLTASMDNTVKVWDVRKLADASTARLDFLRRGSSGRRPAFPSALAKAAPLCEIEASHSVTSAFWSPDGQSVINTCNDDNLYCFDYSGSKAKADLTLRRTIKHNNHTGRWLSNFRARWVPRLGDQRVFIGAMHIRAVEVFDTSDGKRVCEPLANPDLLTAVPTLNAIHPTYNMMVSATGSGRLHLWS